MKTLTLDIETITKGYGIDITTMDGGTDIIMKSSADTGDYCSISTTTNGTFRLLEGENLGRSNAGGQGTIYWMKLFIREYNLIP